MQYPVHEKKHGQEIENHAEVRSKRLFPFEKDSATSNQIKKFKVYTNQVSSMESSSDTSERNFTRHSKVQLSDTLDKEYVSLVERTRPKTVAEYVGQKQIIGPDTVLSYLLEKREILSMIFWGPSGCGKTSLTNIIACISRGTVGNNVHIVSLSAANSGVKNIRDIATAAKNRVGCKTIIFMDEIHRFNKLQQDIFLPHIEAGTFTLIGCTTENPSYSLNPALLSRCRVFMLNKLTESNIREILHRAIKCMNGSILDVQGKQTNDRESIKFHSHSNSEFHIADNTVQWLTEACDGDAKLALNTLELSTLAKRPDRSKTSWDNDVTITLKDVKENLMRTYMLSEKERDQSHHIYSALHKSIKAGKVNASLYWMARIMAAKEDPVNIARRLVRISSEDIGLADPDALGIAVHTMHGCQMIGMPECDVLLGQCTVYLAKAPKSRSIYNALKAAEKVISEHKSSQPTVPLHMRCKSMEENLDCTNNLIRHECSSRTCLPKELLHTSFFQEEQKLLKD